MKNKLPLFRKMKTKNRINSMVFLVAILFSFSVSAYNSLNQLSESQLTSLKKTNIHSPSEASVVSDNIIFEELENEDGDESFSTQAFLLLPFYQMAFSAIITSSPTHTFNTPPGLTEPIFLSNRVIRI